MKRALPRPIGLDLGSPGAAFFLEHTSEAVVVVEGDAVAYLNPAAERALGRRREALLGCPAAEVFPEGLSCELEGAYRRALRARRGTELETFCAALGGWFELRIVPTEGGAAVFFRDVTLRRTQEEALHEATERLRATFEQAAVGIAHVSQDGSWLRVNRRLCEILGYPEADLIQKTFQEVTHPDDLEADLERVGQLVAGEIASYAIEKRYLRRDGATVWANLIVSLVRGAAGEPLYFIAVVEDITQRKWAEERLRLQEAHYRRALEDSGLLAARVDADLRYTWVYNPHPEFDPDSLVGKRDDELARNPGIDQLVSLKQRVLETVQVHRDEITFPLSDGLHTYEIKAVPLLDPGGRISGLTTVSQDITDMRRVESALAEERARSAAVLENVPAVAFLKDMAGRYTYVNPGFERLFGLRLECVLGRTDLELFGPQIAQALAENDQRVLESGAAWEFEESADLSGVRVVYSSVKFVLRGPDGLPTGVGGISVDITERKRAEEELRQTTAQLEALLDNLPLGVALFDRDLRFRRVNAALAQLDGLPEAEHVGRTVGEMAERNDSPPGLAEGVERVLRGVLESGEGVYGFELSGPVAAEPDRVCHSLASWFPVRLDGRTELVGAVLVDITGRKEAEREAALLAGLGGDLARLEEPGEIMRVAGERVARHFGASRVYFARLDEGADTSEVLYDWSAEGGAGTVGTYRLGRHFSEGFLAELRAGRVLAVDDVRTHPITRDFAERSLALGIGASLNAAYLVGGRLRFLLAISSPAPRSWGEGEARLLAELTERVWLRLERAETEAALSESERRFRETFEGMRAVGVTLDPGGRVTFANRFLLELTGWGEAEVLGCNWFERFIPEGLEVERIFHESIARGEIFSHHENEILTRDGQRRLISWDNTLLRDAQGRVAGTASVGRDITDEWAAQAALEASEAQFRELTESIREVFWLTDPLSGRLLYVSPAFEVLWGRSVKELRNNPRAYLEAVHEGDRPRVEAEFPKQLRGETYDVEYRVLRPDGSLRWVRDRAFPVRGESGEVVRVAGVAEDITEYKLAEEALRESEERYRRLAESQKRFVNDAAHELRAPLTAIQGNFELLTRFKGMKKADREAALEEVSAEAARLGRLVGDMLALARGDSGAGLHLGPVRLDRVLREALEAAKGLSRQHDLQAGDLPALELAADPDRLKQLALQLLENALKYTPEGGQVRLSLVRDGDWAELRVADTGIGIPPEELSKVFERFYRSDKARSRAVAGTGLGLPIAQWIVEAHGGRIWLESEVGKGTTAVVRLPLSR
ncbi:MAG: PAS domain S-box protein [Meiothermus sp.]|nr:PAS domain S-box protein [Meiothermus sp.]